jgi:Domain of unknown function (DUF4105)
MRLILILLCCTLSLSARAVVDMIYLAELQAQARQMQLAQRVEWRKLLHHVPRVFAAGEQGLVDSPSFYLAATGKRDAQAELDATLASFYADTLESNETQHPQCAFVARYAWLNSQLNFDAARLPARTCPRFEQWRANLNPAGLTLIFASAYLNSPSSMYGHTLLRVDAKDQNEQTRLLAYAVNFAANTNETNGLAFAVNGLFGGYAGAFAMLPYYAKVREYSDAENRDIWEYRLNLSDAELTRVLMHAWELGPHYFDYFFFDENCSYHLLGLLQVARPEFAFTDEFRWGAIPADTVRAIILYPNLARPPVYRPAQATLLRQQLAAMNRDERAQVARLSHGELNALELESFALVRRAAVLETSLDYVNYRRASGKADVADAGNWARQLQMQRSRLDFITPELHTLAPRTQPELGHASSRLSMAAGQRGKQAFQQLEVRATYHDLLDQDAGFVPGAAIEFFSLAVRHAAAARVERLTPVSIVSLAPRDEFFSAPSWQIAGGWQRVKAIGGGEPLALVLDGGMGGAWSNQSNSLLSYSLLNVSARGHGDLQHGYALGLGASVGSYVDVNTAWRAHPYVQVMRYAAGQQDSVWRLGLQQNIAVQRDLAVRFELLRQRELQILSNTASAAVLVYF